MGDPLPVFLSDSFAPSALAPPSRSFVDLSLPPPTIADDFDAYLAWLAQHFASMDLPMPENQGDLAAKHGQLEPMNAAGSLGMAAGYGWDLEAVLASALRRGLIYKGYIAEIWSIHDDEAAPPTPAEHYLCEEDWWRLAKEGEQLSTVEPRPVEADIHYRFLLAGLIKRLPSQGERMKLLTAFFPMPKRQVGPDERRHECEPLQ